MHGIHHLFKTKEKHVLISSFGCKFSKISIWVLFARPRFPSNAYPIHSASGYGLRIFFYSSLSELRPHLEILDLIFPLHDLIHLISKDLYYKNITNYDNSYKKYQNHYKLTILKNNTEYNGAL